MVRKLENFGTSPLGQYLHMNWTSEIVFKSVEGVSNIVPSD